MLIRDASFETKTKSSYVAFANQTSASYIDIVNISGSGYLVSLSQIGSSSGSIKIVLDGVTLHDETFNPSSLDANLLMLFKFKTSLQVQIKGDGATSQKGAVTYLLD